MTDDEESMEYLQDVEDAKLQAHTVDETFDSTQVCRRCSQVTSFDVGPKCAHAPPLGHPERQTFMSCYCDTEYPMNLYINKLFDRVADLKEDGWVIILDDDNLLTSATAVSDLMLNAEHSNQLVLSRSQLGRLTPSDANLYAKTVVRGDIDASNYMFHTKHLKTARWTGQRCADWRSVDALSKSLEVKWAETITIMSHPLRAAVGGLGGRQDISEKATVILTSYQAEGFRPIWVRNTIEMYCSEEYSVVVDRVILLWNNPDVPPPGDLPSCAVVVAPPVNSLNNRWIATLPYIRTEAILNLDDDVTVTKDGLFCLLNHFADNPTRLIGPFVRRNEGGKYIIDELIKGDQAWTIMLPRIMMLSKAHLETYAAPEWAELRKYVDEQEAHCDDLVLNTVIAFTTKKPTLRVLLPPGSIEDQYNSCYPLHRQATGGLGLQGDRTKLRNECLAHILAQFSLPPLVPSSEVAVCGLRGSRGSIQPANRIDMGSWQNATSYPSCPTLPDAQGEPTSVLPSKESR